MIEIKNLVKCFGKKRAINGISFQVEPGIFGLVGSNGAGKSTLLRVLSGIYRPDGGEVLIDGQAPYENTGVKGRLLFISDFPYFFQQATIESMAVFYRGIYPGWDGEKFNYYKNIFPVDSKMKIAQMSKGMQRQAAMILGLSACPDYLLFDEVFDGLDPVIRELLKKLLIQFVSEREATVIIASHNLRELEDLCDHVGLLHEGGIIYEQELDTLRLGIFKLQAAFETVKSRKEFEHVLDVVTFHTQGRLVSITARGAKDEIAAVVSAMEPIFMEMLPLTLEEVFISEMEASGYDINNLL